MHRCTSDTDHHEHRVNHKKQRPLASNTQAAHTALTRPVRVRVRVRVRVCACARVQEAAAQRRQDKRHLRAGVRACGRAGVREKTQGIRCVRQATYLHRPEEALLASFYLYPSLSLAPSPPCVSVFLCLCVSL